MAFGKDHSASRLAHVWEQRWADLLKLQEGTEGHHTAAAAAAAEVDTGDGGRLGSVSLVKEEMILVEWANRVLGFSGKGLGEC